MTINRYRTERLVNGMVYVTDRRSGLSATFAWMGDSWTRRHGDIRTVNADLIAALVATPKPSLTWCAIYGDSIPQDHACVQGVCYGDRPVYVGTLAR